MALSHSERYPSESFLDEALPVLEIRELFTQQRDAAHSTSVDEANDMDHSPYLLW